MRFYTKQHTFYCGIDLHARTMYLCILNQEGEILVHRNMPAGPAPFLKAIAPYREDLVVCVECIFTWYWLADLCARRNHPAGQKYLARLEKKHGKGKALTVLAHNLARAVSYMLKRETAFEMPLFLQSEHGAERVSLTPNWTSTGSA